MKENRRLSGLPCDQLREAATGSKTTTPEMCPAVIDPDDPLPNMSRKCDCDEYPFASTYQGLAREPSISVKLINGKDNQLVGSRLGAFFSTQRVIDSDPFWTSAD